MFKYDVYRDGKWWEEYRITNATMRSRSVSAGYTYPSSDFTWAPIPEAAVCPRAPQVNPSTCGTPYMETAECCGFDHLEGTAHYMQSGAYHYSDIRDRPDSYRCFQCPAPARGGPLQPLLQHDACPPGFHHCKSVDPNAVSPNKGIDLMRTHGHFCDRDDDCYGDDDNCLDSSVQVGCVTESTADLPLPVSVGLAVTTKLAMDCPPRAGVVTGRTCDTLGNDFEFDAHNHTYLSPVFSSSALFPGPLQRVKYYDEPTIKSIYPRSLPLQTSATLLLKFVNTSLAPWTLAQMVSTKSKCRLEICDLRNCSDLRACQCHVRHPTSCQAGCDSACAEEAMCRVEYQSEDSLLVHLTKDAGGSTQSSLRALALALNGQDWCVHTMARRIT